MSYKQFDNFEGVCPKCNYMEGLEYGSIEFDDDLPYFPFTCPNCGAEGREWHRLEYSCTQIEEKEHE